MPIENENQAHATVLCGHMRQMVHRLRQMSEEHWDWTPHPAAPTARTLGTHAYQWLVCDRQHIAEPDALKHPDVPEFPRDKEAACNLFAEEIERWQAMLLAFTPEEFAVPRRQFNSQHEGSIRGFVAHMVQNCIYKNGQLATLYFALGYDGTEPYDAPFPNPIYAELRAGTLED